MIRCKVHQVNVSLFLSERYFIPVVCFLIFNVMDFIGRTVTLVSKWVSALLCDSFVNVFVSPARELLSAFLEMFLYPSES